MNGTRVFAPFMKFSKQVRPYEAIAKADRCDESTVSRAEEILRSGWKLSDFPHIRFDSHIAWDTVATSSRSWNFHLHAWDFLGPPLMAFQVTKDARFLRWSLDVALDWHRHHNAVGAGSAMAWYDMAIGLRGHRLGFLIEAGAKTGVADASEIEGLEQCALHHFEAFSRDDLFASHSNHGLYFAAGQVALGRRLRSNRLAKTHYRWGMRRLQQMVSDQFTVEGVHREHSPSYHLLVYETIKGLIQAGILHGRDLNPAPKDIEQALAWFVLPDGRLATLGDTQSTSPDPDPSYAPELIHALSRGVKGRAPAQKFRAFRESGYFAMRVPTPETDFHYESSSYLVQTCAFHSRVHKHADDLSFIWSDRGHEILVDPGRFGYLDPTPPESELRKNGFYYGHPSRLYVESTGAHNTIEIDGLSYNRRTTKPYGSALHVAGETQGIYYSGSQVRQFDSIRHARVLAIHPAKWLLVYDWLWDNANVPHQYVQNFVFAPEVKFVPSKSELIAQVATGVPPLHVLTLTQGARVDVARGEKAPLRGWVSRKDGELEAASSLRIEADASPSHTFATLLSFERKPPSFTEVDLDRYGRRATFGWATEDGHVRIQFDRPDHMDANLSVDFG